MLDFDVWEIVPRADIGNRRPITATWVFKAKANADGSVERLKARLCARGFLQRYGTDFFHTFAPVARLSTIRLQVALSAKHDLKMTHLDFKSAFLQGILDVPLYMELPEGWREFLVDKFEKKGLTLKDTDVLGQIQKLNDALAVPADVERLKLERNASLLELLITGGGFEDDSDA